MRGCEGRGRAGPDEGGLTCVQLIVETTTCILGAPGPSFRRKILNHQRVSNTGITSRTQAPTGCYVSQLKSRQPVPAHRLSPSLELHRTLLLTNMPSPFPPCLSDIGVFMAHSTRMPFLLPGRLSNPPPGKRFRTITPHSTRYHLRLHMITNVFRALVLLDLDADSISLLPTKCLSQSV